VEAAALEELAEGVEEEELFKEQLQHLREIIQ
jgi:hypothetical protein